MDKPQDDGETSKLRDNGTNSIIIAADGTHSTLRTQLNIPTETVDYEQRALVTVTHLQRDHDNIAYERFHKTGALALLPLQNNCAATIWTDTEKNIEALLQLSDEEFVINLQHQMGYRLGRFLKIEKRYTYPLKYICMQPHQQIQDNVIFIGNAAHTIHPIAAQGLNIALSEITFLIDHFKSSLTVPRALPEQKNIRLSHQLTQIFAIDFLPFNFARQTGIALLDIFAPAKKKFIRRMIASS
ncbi:MAG: FAD-dependent monooxygenase [Gammaproteobacteria bacterium]|nr:FAD-dependent monooxygenase [Gammaproteobacteria bacterium]